MERGRQAFWGDRPLWKEEEAAPGRARGRPREGSAHLRGDPAGAGRVWGRWASTPWADQRPPEGRGPGQPPAAHTPQLGSASPHPGFPAGLGTENPDNGGALNRVWDRSLPVVVRNRVLPESETSLPKWDVGRTKSRDTGRDRRTEIPQNIF